MKNYLTNLLILEQSIAFFFFCCKGTRFPDMRVKKTIFFCTIRCAIDFRRLKLLNIQDFSLLISD